MENVYLPDEIESTSQQSRHQYDGEKNDDQDRKQSLRVFFISFKRQNAFRKTCPDAVIITSARNMILERN